MILEILNQLNENSETNVKKSILEKYKTNLDLINVFKMAYSYKYVYYFNTKSFLPVDNHKSEISLSEALDIIKNDFEGGQKRGNDAKEFIRDLRSKLSEDDSEVIKRVLLQDLSCGTAINLFNTVHEGTSNVIDIYPCFKPSKESNSIKKKLGFGNRELYVQEKKDGARVQIFVEKDCSVTFRSRSGNLLKINNDYIIKSFLDLFDPSDLDQGGYVLDGELVFYEDESLTTPLKRTISNGLVLKTQFGNLEDFYYERMKFTLWDILPSTKFLACKVYKKTYEDRFKELSEILKDSCEVLDLQENKILTKIEDINLYYNNVISLGGEGLVIKDPKGFWEPKVTKNQMKMKAQKEIDLLVVGYELSEDNKYDGMLKNIKCVSNPNGSLVVTINIGTGLSDADRGVDPEFYLGKIVAVRYNEIIDSQDGEGKTLFLARYLGLRLDKKEPDTLFS